MDIEVYLYASQHRCIRRLYVLTVRCYTSYTKIGDHNMNIAML